MAFKDDDLRRTFYHSYGCFLAPLMLRPTPIAMHAVNIVHDGIAKLMPSSSPALVRFIERVAILL